MRFASQTAAAHYLAGLIDGEGHVAHRSYGRQVARLIDIVNTDKDLLDAAADACDKLGISYITRYRERGGDAAVKSRKPQWDIVIARRSDLERILAVVPLQSRAKADVLRAAVDSYPPLPPYAEVKRMMDAGSTITEIATALGAKYTTARMWCAKVRAGVLENKQAGRPRGRAWSPEERERRMAAREAREGS